MKNRFKNSFSIKMHSFFSVRNHRNNIFLIYILRIFDYFLLIPLLISTPIFFLYARIGGRRLPRSRQFIKKYGVYPIRNHYYFPLFDDSHLKRPLDLPRHLP